MRNFIRSTTLLAPLVAATLLAGCGSTGVGDILGGGSTSDRNDDGTYDQRIDNVRGTIESVNTRDRTIIVDAESTGYSSNLRNGGDEVVLSYDDSTTVEFQGRTFRPEDLERGDRILAEVDSSYRSNTSFRVQEIQVLYDVSGGTGSTSGNGGYNDTYNDSLGDRDIRGTVRYIDTRDRTVEIQTSSSARGFSSGSTGSTGSTSSGVVVVHYDSQTVVEFEGRRYEPENLERGDEVEVEVREVGGRLMAEEILVVGDARSR
jgi:hypothetical protein